MRHGKLNDSMMGPSVDSPAEDIVGKAWDAPTPAKRVALARKALDADLDCIDAYTLLGIEAKTHGERIALFREAVAVGDRLWAPAMDDPDMHWWGFIGTRPYMRALQNLALALEAAGDIAEAGALYRRLLTLNPNDNQGVRAVLARVLLETGALEELEALLAEYPGDFQIELVMARLFLDLRADPGALTPARAAEITSRNAFVLDRLTGRGRKASEVEMSPYGVTMGGEDEALIYAEENGHIWRADKAAMAALRAAATGGKRRPGKKG
ncbi:MAG: tetratricopeptide repeat protein [Rhodobacteraceae bacterium]|nr:tetratricopeptide repeat protein [Paracoccaceae bacterium]